MQVPEDLRYTEEHEWVRPGEGAVVRLGITDYAQDSLGDVVFVQLPPVDKVLDKGAVIAELESTKSVAEVYAPANCRVVAVNEALTAKPELINQDPYGEGWFVDLELADPDSIEGLLDAAAYRALIE
jgi:glycine cleavage system H protein